MRMRNLLSDLLERPLKADHMINHRYVIDRFIGKGSYGLTYETTDFQTGQRVIVKQLRRRKRKQPGGVQSFQREAHFLKTLNHPSIPAFVDAFTEEKHFFLAMEYIHAKNFEDLIFKEGHTYGEREAFFILSRILTIVRYLHKNRIVHRDLRIPNILWNGNQAYIIDFGLARSLDDPDADKHEHLQEESRLFREVSVKSDFFALGHFVLFLLYSQFEPNSKKEKSWEEELILSEPVRNMIRRMLQIDSPYTSVNELTKDVKQFLSRTGSISSVKTL
nr:protein kinase family protein [Bacillus thermotolerans]